MDSRSPTIGRDPSSDAIAEVNDIIRQLIARVVPSAESGRHLGQPPECEEIVLDTDVDGVRYLLVRLPKATRPSVSLSPREEEIVRMVAQGYQNKMIAGVLNISSWTVCTHLRRIFAKLGVTSRAAMVARLLEESSGHEHHPAGDTAPKLAVAAARAGLKTTSPAYGKQFSPHRSE